MSANVRRGARLGWISALAAVFLALGCGHGGDRTARSEAWVPATDPRIQYSDGLHLHRDPVEGVVRFDRVIDGPGRGFRWDAPGARVRWRTDSAAVRVRLRYSTGHTGSSRNSIGLYRVDGRSEDDWTFTRPASGAPELTVELPVPGDRALHDYELILPYGDSIDLLGVEGRPGARWSEPTPRPGTRLVLFGDSVTHGFTASRVDRSYAFQVAERLGWEMVNLGIGGRGTRGADGAFLAGVEADVISIAIGVNDWQAGAELASFRANYEHLLADLRRGHPGVPVWVLTPLWVPPSWTPEAARYPLEQYRAVIREVVAARGDPQLRLVEGPTLIDPDAALFDPVAVHPNDEGFAQMAERLAAALQPRTPAE